MTGTPLPHRPPRHPALVTLDIVVGVVLIVVSIVVGFGVILSAYTYGGLAAHCGIEASGATCSATIGIVANLIIASAVAATLLGVGMFLVAVVRRRFAFWWPLVGIALTVALFYLGTWTIGLNLPAL